MYIQEDSFLSHSISLQELPIVIMIFTNCPTHHLNKVRHLLGGGGDLCCHSNCFWISSSRILVWSLVNLSCVGRSFKSGMADPATTKKKKYCMKGGNYTIFKMKTLRNFKSRFYLVSGSHLYFLFIVLVLFKCPYIFS